MIDAIEVRRSTANPDLIPEETVCNLEAVEARLVKYESEDFIKLFNKVIDGPYEGYNIVHSIKVFQKDQDTAKKYVGGMLAELLDATGLMGQEFKTVQEIASALVGKKYTAEIRQTDPEKSRDGKIRNRLTQNKISRYRSPEEAQSIRATVEAMQRQRQEAAQAANDADIDDIPF